jgi:hypothetical protein
MSRRVGVIVLAVVLPVVALGGLWAGGVFDDAPGRPGVEGADDDAPADYEYLIPAGTGERIDDGERIDILPGEMEVRVGETIRIVNDDDRGHVIGVFYVGAGETLTQTFTAPGELEGECSVHSSGRFLVRVLEA